MSIPLSQTLQCALAPHLPAVFQPAVARLLAADQLDRIYADARNERGSFLSNVANRLSIKYRFADADRARIPKSGPTIVVANHPTGILDGVVLAEVLRTVRSDIKILANALLAAIPETSDIVIPMELYGNNPSAKIAGIRASIEHLAARGLLIVFPAGRISRFRLSSGAIEDADWKPAIARLIRIAAPRVPKLSVIPAHLSGRNSAVFDLANAIHSSLGLALLPRELMKARDSEITMRCSHPVTADRLIQTGSDEECIAYLRWRTHLLAKRCDFKAHTGRPLAARDGRRSPVPIIAAAPVHALREEIRHLPSDRKLTEGDGLEAYIALASEAPEVLREIGRLREDAFRAVGEGTGRSFDIDRFDDHYWHLFLWNDARGEIAGAYRLAQTDVVLANHGINGLYTASLFEYGQPLLNRMGPALELGRSFVRLEYQRGFAPLLLLWKAIGCFVARHPEYRVLFGPVSITNEYSTLAREIMVSYLEKCAALTHWASLVAARMPFRVNRKIPDLSRLNLEVQDLSDLVADIEGDGRGVPVLLRHYLKLGGRLLGFNVDSDFSNSLDGLIVVDLLQTERKLLDRYLGRSEAAKFLYHHQALNRHREVR